MTILYRIVGVIVLWGILVGCDQQQPRPMPIGTDTYKYGYIEIGRRFGVSIGDDREEARLSLLNAGYDFAGSTLCEDSALRVEIACVNGDLFDVYNHHEGLGHKTIYLLISNESVFRIGWSFIYLQIDF